jgi:hypothetical protein
MRKRRVVWSSSTDPALFGLPARHPGHLRQAIRTGVLLAVLGLTRLAGNPRWRSAVIGAGLVSTALILRNVPGDVMLLPGLLFLLYSPLLPGESRESRLRQARLRHELAAYSTASDRLDLELILERHPDSATGELRAILASQPPAHARTTIPGMRTP